MEPDYKEIQWRINRIIDELENCVILTECPNCEMAPSSEGCMCSDKAANHMTAKAYLASFDAKYRRDDRDGLVITLDDGDGYEFEVNTRAKDVVYRVDPYHFVSEFYRKDAMNIAAEADKQLNKMERT